MFRVELRLGFKSIDFRWIQSLRKLHVFKIGSVLGGNLLNVCSLSRVKASFQGLLTDSTDRLDGYCKLLSEALFY